MSALICAAALLTGCHRTPNTSYYGIAWITLTDEPGDYTSYVVTIDSVTLTRSDGVVVPAVQSPEIVDLAQIHNIAELWSSQAIPDGTYVSATITVDYTNAVISFLVNGVPTKATSVLDYTTGKAPTTYAITVDFDPHHQPIITPTYASTSAALISIDFNLAASGIASVVAGVPTVYVRPFLTVGDLAGDTKLIRIRGPLINSSTDISTYTVYIRPFYDEANNLGTLTLFSQPTTVYSLNGNAYTGKAGLDALGVLSAGTTMTAGYTTFEPDYNPLNQAHAGKFNLVYVVAGSTLEDVYTEGITGDVAARSGDTVTLLGSTLVLNTANTFAYQTAKTRLLLGSGTIVTVDNSTQAALTSDAVAVGQHIAARGIYSILSNGTVQIDATGTSSTNTGSVRLQSTELWGSFVSSAAGSLVMDLKTIDNFPVSDFDFAGNGASAAQNPSPAAFSVSTEGLALPAGTPAGAPIWVDGIANAFGAAPPDFKAVAVNNESTVQVAGGQLGGGASTTPGTETCGLGSQVCEPASLEVVWGAAAGAQAPFKSLTVSGLAVNLADPNLNSAVIRIGPESIALSSLPAAPLVVPTALPVTSTFAPRYAWGNPATATTTPTVTSSTALKVASTFADFVTGAQSLLGTANEARQLQANGVYNRTTNTFTATNINLVL